MTNTTRKQNVMAVLSLLVERWPLAFSVYENRRRPLKIGIRDDILAALGDAVTPADLGLALKIYTANPVYRARLVAGAVRIGLDGEPAGIVTAEQVPQGVAQTMVSKFRKYDNHKSGTKKAAVLAALKENPDATLTAPPKPAPSRRISLADLREAARARKAVAP